MGEPVATATKNAAKILEDMVDHSLLDKIGTITQTLAQALGPIPLVGGLLRCGLNIVRHVVGKFRERREVLVELSELLEDLVEFVTRLKGQRHLFPEPRAIRDGTLKVTHGYMETVAACLMREDCKPNGKDAWGASAAAEYAVHRGEKASRANYQEDGAILSRQ